MVSKGAESILQQGFHGRRRCRIVRSLVTCSENGSEERVGAGERERGLFHFPAFARLSQITTVLFSLDLVLETSLLLS